MEQTLDITTIVNKQITASSAKNLGKATALTAYLEKAEYNRFGLTPVIIVIVACLGGFAAAFAVQMGALQLSAVVLATALVQAMMLNVMSMKYIFYGAIISITLSILAMLF